ncbi:hypothetical protein FHT05_003994 [Xanthomonas arboricola]|uniref:hypothetical protein n=1 Tax=Xanthomonas arboricola TaxID=56448 RepID=UPI00161009F3|nr:hypothetical protein [Xanthomonas arboricola]MBB6259355.1 hypothetical protein [Xanthomonas arboricola]
MLTAWIGFIGVLAGALVSGGVGWFTEIRRERRQSKSLAVAVAAEAAAIAEIVRRREYVRTLVDHAMAARGGTVLDVQVKLPSQVAVVIKAARDKAGTLPDQLPSLVPKLAMLIDSLEADIHRLFEHPVDSPRALLDSTEPQWAAAFYAEMLAIMCSVLWYCDLVVGVVKRLHPAEAAALVVCRSQLERDLFPYGEPGAGPAQSASPAI